MEQGVELLIVGMGVVFCFLIILVFAVQAMGNILRRIAPSEPSPQPTSGRKGSNPEPDLIVAVAAAQRYRSSN